MNLDPTVSPWLGIVASTGVCLWMAAIGLPLSRAVFGDRPRPVWPFYAPALGIVVVLLVTNLSAYLIPGAPSAWFGLLAPSALAAYVAWRTHQFRVPSRQATLPVSLALLVASAATFVVAFTNRTQVRAGEETWHFPLVLRMARGVFPPVTPYGQDAGIGYHYGPDFLAASIVNTAGVPPWTAVAVLTALLVVALVLAAVGFRLGYRCAAAAGHRLRRGACPGRRPRRVSGCPPMWRDTCRNWRSFRIPCRALAPGGPRVAV